MIWTIYSNNAVLFSVCSNEIKTLKTGNSKETVAEHANLTHYMLT